MSRSYKATGINLKAMPMGEADRLVTVLTAEHGLVRAIAPGARKHSSRLAGRSGLFVVNELLFAQGKSLDKLVQAETIRSFPGLSQDLGKLTASQYLAEIVLSQALSEQPQPDLFHLLLEHLTRLETAAPDTVLAHLAHATFHLLALAGVAPELFVCCLSRSPLQLGGGHPDGQVGFSIAAGGTVNLSELGRSSPTTAVKLQKAKGRTAETARDWNPHAVAPERPGSATARWDLTLPLQAAELNQLQQLSQPQLELSQPSSEAEVADSHIWRRIERILRQYAQYHLDRPIRSAALIETCFAQTYPRD
ncbi:DNA repair protein RecO [Romeria aff. gracilis LEGE 07310]|uniref:DNA repair protein RecO n=1 Tax=Vasconcelosia minhoensis LEGE 07310 TaxID=915328 RepID=A0A8J7DK47_9CYAN|nr:DNA repair protein RecO [Romeria gracilis]MBE9075936.1 DNA repair protein RecO [Romeria aff. gracilis LEGE 07310]